MFVMQCCDKCGQILPLDEVPPTYLVAMERKLFRALTRAGNVGLDAERLVHVLYSDRRDGGPFSAEKCVQVSVCRMNKKLIGLGIEITRSENRYSVRRNLRSLSSLDRAEHDTVTRLIMKHIARASDISQIYIAEQHNLLKSEVRDYAIQLRSSERRKHAGLLGSGTAIFHPKQSAGRALHSETGWSRAK
jgi:hypothetical protein